MYGSITARCRRLTLISAAALALTVVPYRISLHGSAPGIDAVTAQAAKGGNGGGNSGNGNGNGGNSGTDSSGDGSGASNGQSDKGASHVNTTTGDKVDVSGNKITVTHPDGIVEKVDSGRFKMQDALGRTIIDRRATPADVSRLKAL